MSRPRPKKTRVQKIRSFTILWPIFLYLSNYHTKSFAVWTLCKHDGKLGHIGTRMPSACFKFTIEQQPCRRLTVSAGADFLGYPQWTHFILNRLYFKCEFFGVKSSRLITFSKDVNASLNSSYVPNVLDPTSRMNSLVQSYSMTH